MNRFCDAARRWLVLCGQFERAVSFAAFLFMIAVVFVDVVSRELTGSGLHWASQLGVYANIVVVMLGIGLASAHGSHLRPRFADGWLPACWDPVLNRVADGLMAAFCGGFTLLAGLVVAETAALGERSSVLGTLVWPVQLFIPLAFGLATIRHALYALCPELAPRQTGSDIATT